MVGWKKPRDFLEQVTHPEPQGSSGKETRVQSQQGSPDVGYIVGKDQGKEISQSFQQGLSLLGQSGGHHEAQLKGLTRSG